MNNERIIFMEGEGRSMDEEVRNFVARKAEALDTSPPTPEGPRSKAEQKAAHPGRQRGMEPGRRSPFTPAPEGTDEAHGDKPEDVGKGAEEKTEDKTEGGKEEEKVEEMTDREKMDKLVQLKAEGKEDEAQELIADMLPEDAENKGKKTELLSDFAEEMGKKKDEQDPEAIIGMIQKAGDDKDLNGAIKKNLELQGYTPEEIDDMYDKAGLPAPDGEEAEEGTEELIQEGPTGMEGDIKAFYDAKEEENYDKLGQAAEKLMANLKKLEKLKGPVKILFRTVLYAAIAAVVIYVGIMAKIGNSVKK